MCRSKGFGLSEEPLVVQIPRAVLWQGRLRMGSFEFGSNDSIISLDLSFGDVYTR